jgi:hypothetical protein
MNHNCIQPVDIGNKNDVYHRYYCIPCGYLPTYRAARLTALCRGMAYEAVPRTCRNASAQRAPTVVASLTECSVCLHYHGATWTLVHVLM